MSRPSSPLCATPSMLDVAQMFRRAESLNDEPLLSTAQAAIVSEHLRCVVPCMWRWCCTTLTSLSLSCLLPQCRQRVFVAIRAELRCVHQPGVPNHCQPYSSVLKAEGHVRLSEQRANVEAVSAVRSRNPQHWLHNAPSRYIRDRFVDVRQRVVVCDHLVERKPPSFVQLRQRQRHARTSTIRGITVMHES